MLIGQSSSLISGEIYEFKQRKREVIQFNIILYWHSWHSLLCIKMTHYLLNSYYNIFQPIWKKIIWKQQTTLKGNFTSCIGFLGVLFKFLFRPSVLRGWITSLIEKYLVELKKEEPDDRPKNQAWEGLVINTEWYWMNV